MMTDRATNATRAPKRKKQKQVQKPKAPRANWRAKFLVALAECGNVSEAAKAAGVNRTAAHRARQVCIAKRLVAGLAPAPSSVTAGDEAAAPSSDLAAPSSNFSAPPGDFAAQWDEAIETAIDALEHEARRRAVKGVDEPVFYQGNVCGVVTRYSDTLLIQLLKAHRPEKYRERHELTGPNGEPMRLAVGKMSDAEIVKDVARLLGIADQVSESDRSATAAPVPPGSGVAQSAFAESDQ